MKKIPLTNLDLKKLRVQREDDPLADFPLLKMRGQFHLVNTNSLLATNNNARGISKEHGGVDALAASFKRGWDPGKWPFPYITINNVRRLIDRRHSKAAAEQNLITELPAVEYVRVKGTKWDFLSDEAVNTIAAIKLNVDGTTNATQDHFAHGIKWVCKHDNLDNTDIDLIRGLLDLAGVNERYSYQGTITAIENKILDDSDAPTLVSNTTDEEFNLCLDKLDRFGDNATAKDGTLLYVMTADKRVNKRYAWDLLRHIWEAEDKGKNVRYLIRSKATTAAGVRKDRQDLFEKVVEYCNLAYGNYTNFASKAMNESLPSYIGRIELPRRGAENLPCQIYVLNQLEGETEPMEIDLLDYYMDI